MTRISTAGNWNNRAGTTSAQGGFTLIELVVVCLIISILLIAGLPTLRDTMFTDPLKAGVRKTIGLVREARETAVRERHPYLIRFDRQQGRIWFEKDATDTEIQDDEDKQRDHDAVLQLPPSTHIDDIRSGSGSPATTEPELWISAQGYMDQAVIHLRDDQDNILAILISPFLTTIEVRKGHVELED